ncbi:hypothetical protein [Sulfuricystis multivorans]|uniref:hypothetical protein n=1 Tax=Sulfuricystis multivorans TaxID=2211108 RepID=UPI000F84989A|nr:hypothetical protein [Sulfuricystis multivorans]
MRIGSLFLALVFPIGAALADQTSTFNDAKNFAAGKAVSGYGNINAGSAQDKIPGYGTSPVEANYFAGGQGQTSSFGVQKMQTCATATPDPDPFKRQECEAVNFLAHNPQVRPQFNISKNDSMLIREQAISQNAQAVAQQFGLNIGESSTQCVTRTETTQAQYTTETCSSIKEVEGQQCTMGRVINIDADSNFQCEQTIHAYETGSCYKEKVVTFSCPNGGTLSGSLCIVAPTAGMTTGITVWACGYSGDSLNGTDPNLPGRMYPDYLAGKPWFFWAGSTLVALRGYYYTNNGCWVSPVYLCNGQYTGTPCCPAGSTFNSSVNACTYQSARNVYESNNCPI